jgi:hypothetical protein
MAGLERAYHKLCFVKPSRKYGAHQENIESRKIDRKGSLYIFYISMCTQ